MSFNVKDLIASITGKKKNNKVGRYNESSPEVRIDNVELAVTLGQWMGILPDAVKSGGNGMFVISSLDASELIKRNGTSRINFDSILSRFSNLLSMVGFSGENTCVLNNFDEETLSFSCTFQETGESALIKIRFGSWLEECPALIIDFDGIVTNYDYWHADKKNPDRLNLSHIVKKLDKEGTKKFYRYVSEFRYIGNVYDENNKVEVEIQYPESLEYGYKENPYVDESLLEELLASVNFPVDVEALVAKIPSVLSKDVKDYPTISVVSKEISKERIKNDKVIDEAVFKHGEFDKLTLTRNGRKITVDQFDAWSYSTDVVNVAQTITPDQSKTINYGYSAIPVDDFEQLATPQELISEAREHVNGVKTLAKTMLTKRTTK